MRSPVIFGIGLLVGALCAIWVAQSYFFQAGELRLIASLRLADGGVYAGDTDADGLLSGSGRVDWANGSYYVGEFQHGQFHGQGRYVGTTGFSAAGAFEDGQLTGVGRTEYLDGTHYEGDFKHGLMHGHGKMVFANGNSWDGEFSNDKMTGSGTWKEHNGIVYIGEMKAGKFDGMGEITYEDKSGYVGQFRKGNRHGQGVFDRADGTQYSGDFVDGEFSGTGTIAWPKQRGTYVGTVAGWQPDGKGITRSKGRQMIGTFKQGKLDGKGEFRGPEGQHYKGGFEDGQYSGQGVWVDSDGNRYEGEFEYGEFHGKGHYTYAEPLDGIASFNGTWSWGRLVSGDDQLVIHDPEEVSEHFLYQQSDQLETALAGLKPGDPEQIELYTLALGPYGDEEVFNREINYIERQFKENYDAGDHGLFFSNSRRNLDDRPMATVTSLQRGLDAIAAKMDTDQDILFLYMTTHGSKKHVLAFDQTGMDLPDLSANELGEILDNSGIKWKVVVLSACYSGGFIDRLKNDNTLIFTAAAADKASFGCNDNMQFTYFGDAFFRQSLPKTESFNDAFDQAVELIAKWEQDEELESSNPQNHRPGPIIEQLRIWRENR